MDMPLEWHINNLKNILLNLERTENELIMLEARFKRDIAEYDFTVSK